MSMAAMTVAVLLASNLAGSGDEQRLAGLVEQVRDADYRGERAELRRLASALDGVKSAELLAYRDYWRGFALWRRALNGFNETPNPADLGDDLREGVRSFKAALVRRPGWVEAQVGLVGCWASLVYLARDDKAQQQEILAEYLPVGRAMNEQGGQNPRVLWLVGGLRLGAPPPYGGDAPKALATYRQGIEAAQREARAAAAAPWEPAWGGPELLMSLAYLHTHSALANRELAQAYLDGALTAVPHWHYVADVLRPQVQALAAPAASPPPAPPAAPAAK
jgi:hypothetical protein